MKHWSLVFLAACAAPISGVAVERPQPGPAESRATTADGVRVLLNGRVDGSSDGTWMATTDAQLRRLWRRVGGSGDAPDVDFDRHVVLGAGFEDGPCQGEISAVEVDASGTLTMKVEPLTDACIALAVRVGVLVVVPRSVLPESFVWAPRGRDPWVRRFSLPPFEGSRTPPSTQPTLEGEVAEGRGIVELPAPGRLALRTLDDGREVWVAHHVDGTIAVVAADWVPSPRTSMRQRVTWNERTRRFGTGHDSFGRSVTGDDALPVHAFRRADAGIEIGELAELPEGPILPREDAPELEGPDSPYENATPVSLDALPEGRVVRVEAPLVLGLEGPPRVCTPPSDRKMLAHFLGCTEGPTHGRSETRPGVSILGGPLVVRRRGDELDLVIGMGGGSSSGVREHRILPAAPRGETRARGRIAIGRTVSGDTTGARDGFAPSCVGAPGGPDESWELRSSTARRVALVLESEFDGALAIVRGDGAVLDCNDDRHGHYRSSVVHVDLQPNVPVRVIVDGFGGASGAYTLSAVHEDPVPNDGVLTLDAPVDGDTTHATDDESTGCHAPGHDQAFRFEVSEAGEYVFRVEGEGWSPSLSVRSEDGRTIGCGGGGTSSRLEPGTYVVVVDAASADAHGRYRLSVSRATE